MRALVGSLLLGCREFGVTGYCATAGKAAIRDYRVHGLLRDLEVKEYSRLSQLYHYMSDEAMVCSERAVRMQ